jgi:hypothetical protein
MASPKHLGHIPYQGKSESAIICNFARAVPYLRLCVGKKFLTEDDLAKTNKKEAEDAVNKNPNQTNISF